jgi:hypothetical protein
VATMKKSVRVWGAVTLGLGTMAPTLALSLNVAAPAARVGRAAPLAFAVGRSGSPKSAPGEFAWCPVARRLAGSDCSELDP